MLPTTVSVSADARAMPGREPLRLDRHAFIESTLQSGTAQCQAVTARGCNRWLSAGTEKATLLVFTTKTGTWHSAMAQGG